MYARRRLKTKAPPLWHNKAIMGGAFMYVKRDKEKRQLSEFCVNRNSSQAESILNGARFARNTDLDFSLRNVCTAFKYVAQPFTIRFS